LTNPLTIRGSVEFTDGSTNQPVKIFGYESPDRTKAWRVTGAFVWPQTVEVSGAVSSNVQGSWISVLSTDDFAAELNNAKSDDNRQFGWGQHDYAIRNNAGATQDYLHGKAGIISQSQLLLDPGHLVVQNLFLQMSSHTEGGTQVRKWNYMVVLEKRTVSPPESILQQLKGTGQSI